MSSREVVLCHPVRTAIGTYNGTLKGTPATDLGASVVRETLRRSGLDPAHIGSVVMGQIEERSIEQAELERFVPEADKKICPHSHATRGNVPVTLEVIGK
jgi:acetyl-CoA acetyltransferase